jgi:hypothetical protein
MTTQTAEVFDIDERTIDDLIKDRAQKMRELKAANALVKDLKQEQDELDRLLMWKMDRSGVTRVGNDAASVSIGTDVVPDVTDWEAVYGHILTTKDFSLIQRRVSSTAYREILNMGDGVPGLAPREIRRINFRNL